MTDVLADIATGRPNRRREKFFNPDVTAAGEPRASVALERIDTLWINTGTLCNIECVNCYIESSPTNDRLEYISAQETASLLDEAAGLGLGIREIGFTGGEPFMNPGLPDMLEDALARGHEVLVLTNAMQPMQRKRIKQRLLELHSRYGSRLSLRVSLDHHTREFHETERGQHTWEKTLDGVDWLAANGFSLSIAGRTCWGEDENVSRRGYASLIQARGWPIDANDPASLVLFPEMDETVDVPEITTACWSILGVTPSQQMCASSRMVVKRKGAASLSVVPCTLLPYDRRFDMGASLAEAAKADGGMFERGAVKLCHPHCSRFCVLGGGKCSA